MFRHTTQNDLIEASTDERWYRYRDNRNDKVHDYGRDFAETTLKLMATFVEDAKALAAVIEQSNEYRAVISV